MVAGRKILRGPILILGSGLLLLGMCALSVALTASSADVRVRIRSSEPRIALREAGESWQAGRYAQAIPQYARGVGMALDSSLRWRIADAFIEQSETYFGAGEAEAGFESCRTAVRVLGGYSGGILIAEGCWDVYMLHFKQTRLHGGQAAQ